MIVAPFIPLIVCLSGLVMYLVANPRSPGVPMARASAVGFAMFWVGLFVALMTLDKWIH